jgi:hypothetical protein
VMSNAELPRIRPLESRVSWKLASTVRGGRMEKVSQLVSRKGLRTPGQAENLASRLPYFLVPEEAGSHSRQGMAMVNCMSCSRDNPPGQRRCRNCGADLSETPGPVMPIDDDREERARSHIAAGPVDSSRCQGSYRSPPTPGRNRPTRRA